MNGSNYFSSSASRRTLTPAPRIVPQSESQLNNQPSFIMTLLLLPFNLLYYLISKPLGLFSYLFPFLPTMFVSRSGTAGRSTTTRNATGRRTLNPRDTAARFIRELEEEYGSSELPFLEMGYAQALDMAKKDLKFLLVILVSTEHDDTASFIQNTLLSSNLTNFIKEPSNGILLWAGNVQDSEAYQVSASLNCTKFPFAVLIAHTPQVSATSMSVVARAVGTTTPTAFVAKLQDAVAQHSDSLNQARASRASRDAERSLREQQNSAYERSLAQDRERARQRREAENARKEAEAAAKKKVQLQEQLERNVQQWKLWRAQSLSEEPGAGAKDAIRVSIRLPSGERLIRKFGPDATMEELYAFVECHKVLKEMGGQSTTKLQAPEGYEHKFEFRLISPMPRTTYEPDKGVLIGERVGKNSNLIFEPISDEEETDA